MTKLRVILIKPSKYGIDGKVERFEKGFMPNATLYHIASLTPASLGTVDVETHVVDEYVNSDLGYLKLLSSKRGCVTLLALVGVQSHQFHRALDLSAYAKSKGVECVIIGGPHVMTCDTTFLQGKGVSFAISEAENVWKQVLRDAAKSQLEDVYGQERRWAPKLSNLVINPPPAHELENYWAPMLGIYPVRGCPYSCSFCSVIKISGRKVRSEGIDSTIQSLRLARKNGIDTIMFVSDNFNKFPYVHDLLDEIQKEKLGIRFFCQCDTQISKEPDLIENLARAGCFEIFVGVESFDRETLKNARKFHNRPADYKHIVNACDEVGIRTHFSNIIGFLGQTRNDVGQHLDYLKELRPKVASFYILTPIPGTEQYDAYMNSGLVEERNMDRFDGTWPTMSHPHFSKTQLLNLLFDCYLQYNRFLLRNVSLDDETKRLAIFNRYMAQHRMHPMAGGIDRIAIDGVTEYKSLRQQVFEIELLPLPKSLTLSDEDKLLNRSAKLSVA